MIPLPFHLTASDSPGQWNPCWIKQTETPDLEGKTAGKEAAQALALCGKKWTCTVVIITAHAFNLLYLVQTILSLMFYSDPVGWNNTLLVHKAGQKSTVKRKRIASLGILDKYRALAEKVACHRRDFGIIIYLKFYSSTWELFHWSLVYVNVEPIITIMDYEFHSAQKKICFWQYTLGKTV